MSDADKTAAELYRTWLKLNAAGEHEEALTSAGGIRVSLLTSAATVEELNARVVSGNLLLGGEGTLFAARWRIHPPAIASEVAAAWGFCYATEP